MCLPRCLSVGGESVYGPAAGHVDAFSGDGAAHLPDGSPPGLIRYPSRADRPPAVCAGVDFPAAPGHEADSGGLPGGGPAGVQQANRRIVPRQPAAPAS